MSERDDMQTRAETAPVAKPNVNKLANAIARAIRQDGQGLNASEVLTLALAAEKFQTDIMLSSLQAINVQRSNRWHGGDFRVWSGLEWAGALCGEAGELANVAKKLRRVETGAAGNAWSERPLDVDALRAQYAGECADVQLYLVMCAARYDVKLANAVREKFNTKSEEMGFPERL